MFLLSEIVGMSAQPAKECVGTSVLRDLLQPALPPSRVSPFTLTLHMSKAK